MKKTITIFSMLAVCVLASLQSNFACASTLPPNEAWTESTHAKNEFGWGSYEGAQTSITADASDKKEGKISIKYSGINNKAGGALGPALIFPKGHYIDITPFAGGNFSFDIKLGDLTNFAYMQLVLMSDGVQAHQVSKDIKLKDGWNHI